MRSLTTSLFLQTCRRLLLPFLSWLLFVCYEQLSLYFSQGGLGPLWKNLCYYSMNIGLFYVQQELLRRFIGKTNPRYFLAGLCTFLLLIVFVILKSGLNYLLSGSHQMTWHELGILMLWDADRSIYFIGLSCLLWTVSHMETFRRTAVNAERNRLILARDHALLEKEIAETRSAYYQHQLNPHLLFNTLNFIYNSVDRHSPEAAKGVLLLSEILRFSLSDRDPQGKVPLAEEVAQLDNLVGINRLRYAGTLAVDYRCQGDFGPFRIIPLILLTLTENLFKHGLINDPAHPARLSITIDPGGQLIYRCINQKKRPQDQEASGQLGLRNVRLRLDQAYGSAYTLDAGSAAETYHLELKLQL